MGRERVTPSMIGKKETAPRGGELDRGVLFLEFTAKGGHDTHLNSDLNGKEVIWREKRKLPLQGKMCLEEEGSTKKMAPVLCDKNRMSSLRKNNVRRGGKERGAKRKSPTEKKRKKRLRDEQTKGGPTKEGKFVGLLKGGQSLGVTNSRSDSATKKNMGAILQRKDIKPENGSQQVS